MYDSGRYLEVLEEIEQIQTLESQKTQILHLEVLKGRCLTRLGEFEKAIEVSQHILEKETTIHEQQGIIIDAKIAMTETYWRTGQIEESLKCLEDVEKQFQSLDMSQDKDALQKEAALLHQRGSLHLLQGQIDDCLEIYHKSLEIRRKLPNKADIAETLNTLCIAYRIKGDYTQALEYGLESLSLRESIKNENDVASALNNLAAIYYRTGDFDKALKVYQRCLDIKRGIGNKQEIAGALVNIGLIYQNQGNLDGALEVYQEGLSLDREIGNMLDIAVSLSNIGMVHQMRGDLDIALDCYQEALSNYGEMGSKVDMAECMVYIGTVHSERGDLDDALEIYQNAMNIFTELNLTQKIAQCQHNVGNLYYMKGDFEISLEMLKQSLTKHEASGNRPSMSENLLSLVLLCLDMDDIGRAQEYVEHFKQIDEDESSKLVNQRRRIAEALVLRTASRTRDKARAESMLADIAEEEVLDHGLTVTALVGLCDILLDELRSTGEKEVLWEIKINVEKLRSMAEKQNSYLVLAETYWLESQLALLEFEPNEALRLLNKAQLIADEKGLRKLAMKFSNEYDSLLDELVNWETLNNQKASMKERIEAVQLDKVFGQMTKKQEIQLPRTQNEEPVQFMLVAANAGFSLVNKVFEAGVGLNESLVSGFLTAISTFSEEIFSRPLERIKIGDYTLLMKAEMPFLFCYVFRGQSYPAMRKMTEFIDAMHQESDLWDSLESIITTGTVDQSATATVDQFVGQIFAGAT